MNRSIQLSVHGQAGTLIRPLHVGRLECPHTFLASTGSLTNAFRYTGREFDLETSLYYYRARYYDPNTGRLIAEDPLRFRGGLDFYSYVSNGPLNRKDPYGLFTINLGGTFNLQTGPINWQFSGGLVIGTDGSFGTYTTKGVGLGLGSGAFFGLTGGISTAKGICGFGGPFYEAGQSAGAGVAESVSAYGGFDSSNGNAPVGGGSVTVGIGGGASAYGGGTVTTVTPIISAPGSSGCGCQ